MKILITTDLYKPTVNGVVISVLNLKKGLEDKGHEVRILTLSPGCRSFSKNGVYLIGSINTSVIYPGTRIKIHCPHSFIDELISWHPDVVHSQCEFSTFGFACRIARECNAPLVHTYHTVYEDYTHYFCPIKPLGRFIAAFLTRYYLKRTDAVVTPSLKVTKLLRRYKVKKPVTIIPTGINLHSFSKDPGQKWIGETLRSFDLTGPELRMIYIGRLAKEKNIQELLQLTAACSDLPVKLVIVGDGPVKNGLVNLVKKLHIEDRVVFTGMVSPKSIGRYYHLGDVFVNASNSETQGLTYIEAMAAGLPMLCKKDNCLEGIIEDGVNGWQYENAEDFKAHLETLIDNMDLKRRMASNSSLMSHKFSIEGFAESALKLYMERINKKNR